MAASEQTAVRRFDIAAGDLTEVLSRYASAAGAASSVGGLFIGFSVKLALATMS